MQKIEKWDIFEAEVKGKSEGNPFTDYEIYGTFRGPKECVTVDGFYDGDGTYRVRFMPSQEGTYTYRIAGSFSDEGTEGSFLVTSAVSKNNHGRVQVADGSHFLYEDQTPYYSVGTTCYAWVHQEIELQEQTLETLAHSPFNKIRFCVFPKFYDYNRKEPITYPFERGNGEGLDQSLVEKEERERILFPGMQPPVLDLNFHYQKFNLEHFRRFDQQIRRLRDLGIEADLILMHPYDRWGLNMMSPKSCDLYLKYVNARFGAYRNVWWSLANEYDLIVTKSEADWERYAAIFCEKDPYHHLRSIHNCMKFYDYKREWMSHCSLQRVDFYRHVEYTDEYMETYQKPVVWDEICYEGNLPFGWGNLTPEELVRRFWEAVLRGGHAGHGETFLDEKDLIWWSHGGILKGESPERLAFLLKICQETPGRYLKKGKGIFDEVVGVSENPKEEPESDNPFEISFHDYEIHYLGISRPAYRMFYLPEEEEFEIDVIDTWEMTVTPMGVHKGITRIELPEKQYMAVRLRRKK